MNHPLGPARRGSGDGDDAHALTGPYAVDALDAGERALVERHLESCPACRDEVRELRETAARLAATTAVPPPDRLRSRVLAEIGTVRQAPPAGTGTAPPRPARFGGARLPWLAAAAMFVAVVVLGALLADARSGESGAETRADRIAAIVTAPDTRTVTATGDGATATALTSRSRDEALVVASGLHAPGPAHVWQVWFMTDQGARSAGLLDDVSAGQNAVGRLVAEGLGDAARIGVTLEPAGGSPAPTTPPVVVMTLPV
ncbi:anti-sigma factor [Yinghuangia sp. YIM S09857]|uniref:anti-sigma factor n=1 Tax=Yinghuangia sp. YIM S09857 TaxID=3436929 RepID=UPI003F5394DC